MAVLYDGGILLQLSADGSKLYSLVLYRTVQKHSISADETMQYSQLLATNR